jgi:hypothetical protein
METSHGHGRPGEVIVLECLTKQEVHSGSTSGGTTEMWTQSS